MLIDRSIGILAAVALFGCAGTDESGAGGSTTSPNAPQPGAPDEHCDPDPNRVYLVEQPYDHIGYTSLTDLEDPSVLCAYRENSLDNVRLDPTTGGLLTLRGDRIWRVTHDWMELNGPGSDLWVPGFDGEENDEELGRVMYALDITCRGKDPDNPYVLLTDDVNVYASCDGMWFNAPQIEGLLDWRNVVGLVDGRRIFRGEPLGLDGYRVDVPGDDTLESIPLPGNVDALTHLAVRPVAGALVAAVRVLRGDVATTEQARIDANGVTLSGTYAHDLDTIGIPLLECAMAADATIFCLELFAIGDDEEVPRRIVRMTLTDPPEVIATTTFYAEDRPSRLLAVGASVPALR